MNAHKGGDVPWFVRWGTFTILYLSLLLSLSAYGQDKDTLYWNSGRNLLIPFRLPPSPAGHKPQYIDLDNDGRPEVLRTVTATGTPVQWIDDDGSMRYGDLEGSTRNGCLMIDRNRDGVYGGYGDLIIDWVDRDEAGNPAMMVVVENCEEDEKLKRS